MNNDKMREALRIARNALLDHGDERSIAPAIEAIDKALAEQPAQGEACEVGHNPDRCDRETCNVLAVCFAAPPAPAAPEVPR